MEVSCKKKKKRLHYKEGKDRADYRPHPLAHQKGRTQRKSKKAKQETRAKTEKGWEDTKQTRKRKEP